ncbi:hypothetical protein [Streptomyces sp. 8N706]|uniref:hypothetical protein n=1 Tax=Streptomyces sp. 8N706 TaxID=3457416 RepID=UPI003FD60E1B
MTIDKLLFIALSRLWFGTDRTSLDPPSGHRVSRRAGPPAAPCVRGDRAAAYARGGDLGARTAIFLGLIRKSAD